MEIKLIMILASMIFFGSCKNQKFICSEIRQAKIDPVVMYDISFVFNRCRARCFDVNKWETLPLNSCPQLVPPEYEDFKIDYDEKGVAQAINLDLEDCEGVAGFNLDAIGKEIRPKVKRLASLKVDSCGE